MNPVTSVVAPEAPQSGHTRSESRRKRVRKTSNPASHETHARSYVGMWTLSLAVIPANTIASEREPHERGRREDPAHPHPARLTVSPESAPMPVTMLDEVNAGVAHAPLSAANHNLLRRVDAAGQRLFRELLTAHIPWATATEVRRLIAVDVVAVSVLAARCHHPQPCAIDHCLDSLEMKAVLGNRSPRLPGLILSSGAGVGGHALRSGRTMYTPEYASSAVDQDLVSVAADDEGIVSLLAVPISFAGVVRAMLHVGWITALPKRFHASPPTRARRLRLPAIAFALKKPHACVSGGGSYGPFMTTWVSTCSRWVFRLADRGRARAGATPNSSAISTTLKVRSSAHPPPFDGR